MPAILFVLKWVMKLFAIGVMLKALAWIFDISSDEDERETVGWFAEVRADPSRLFRPLFFFVVLPLVTYASLYWALHSTHPVAVALVPWLGHLWALIKWALIVFTVVGVNWFLYIIYLKCIGDKQDAVEMLIGLTYPWFYSPFLGILLMIFLNIAFVCLIYRELPAHWQTVLLNLV